MGTQGTGRKRSTKKERSTAEDDALNLIAREAEARLAAKRAARAEAREIRMKELERQQKEIFQVQKEDSERYSRSSRIHTLSDDDERMSVGSRGSVRGSSLPKKSKKKKKHKHKDRDRNGYDDEYSVVSDRSSRLSDESRMSRSSRLDLTSSRLSDDSRLSRASRSDLQPASYDLYSLNGLSSTRNPGSAFNGYQSSLYEDSLCGGSRRGIGSSSHPLEYTSYRSSSSRASSRAGSARASPVDNCSSVASFLRSAASSGGLPRDLDDVTIPDFSDVEDKDYLEKGSRAASALTAATLTSLGGTSSRRGSGETALTVDAESSIREIKEIHELKDQIQDVEAKYAQNLKEVKDALAEVEEKYRKAMVSNAQLDNEKNNLMYQVDTLKDSLMELEELLSESRREYEEKVKEYEREKYAHGVLQFQFNEMKETLKQSEGLLNEIRQLRVKQEGFVREISDLQETVEWKDKKIGALERQKEYTDAIRIERDELREEVVKLKDILKKHGIVLGPDLSVNGDVGVAEVDGSPDAESASQPAQDSQTSPAEGNSMLGNTEETELRSSREDEEVDPEQQQEIHEEAKENPLSSAALCNVADLSAVESSRQEQQTCLPVEQDSTGENDLNKDLSLEINDSPTTEAKDIIDCSSELQEIVTETEMSEEANLKEASSIDLVEKETKISSVDTNGAQDRERESAGEVLAKENLTDESVLATSNPEPQQEPKNAEEAENDEAEETPSKSQSQSTTASGKKKKKKRKGKKKGGAQDDKNQQKNETANKNKKDKDVEPAGRNGGATTESNVDGSVPETLKESKMDQVENEQDKKETAEVDAETLIEPSEVSLKETLKEARMDQVLNDHDEENTLKSNTAEEVAPSKTLQATDDENQEQTAESGEAVDSSSQVETLKEFRTDSKTDDQCAKQTNNVEEAEVESPVENPCQMETLNEVSDVTEEQNKDQILKTEDKQLVEAVEPAESVSHLEAFKESTTDSNMDDQGAEQTLETSKIEEAKVVVPVENPCQEETLNKLAVDDVTEEQNPEQSLGMESVESAEAVEPTESFSHLETPKGSGVESKSDDQDDKETLKVETFEEVEVVAPTENLCYTQTPSEVIEDHVTGEQNKGLNLEIQTVESVEAVESFSPVETLKESKTDSEKDEQDLQQTLETEKVKEMESITSPNPEANICTADLSSNSAESTDVCRAISADSNISNTDHAENEVESIDKNKTEEEPQVPSNGEIPADESESTSESKDDPSALQSSTDDATDGIKSSSGCVRDDPPIEVSDEGPEESADGELRVETSATSPTHDGLNSEDRNLKEPEDLVNPDEKSDSCDGASSAETPEAFSTGKSLLEDEQLETNTVALSATPPSPKEVTETGSSTEQESAVTGDQEPKKGQHDEESEPSPCSSGELPHESSKDERENKDSSGATQVGSDREDDDEDDEGQSFDFDDMDVEAAIESTPPQNPEQEEVDEGVEITSSDAESDENTQDKPAEGNDQVDQDSVTVPQEDQNSSVHEEATSESGRNACEKQNDTPDEKAGEEDQPEQATEEGIALGAVAENINQAASSLVEPGLDAAEHALQGDADLPKSADQAGTNKAAAAAQSGKDTKKSAKKGKGKGKEDCKMS